MNQQNKKNPDKCSSGILVASGMMTIVIALGISIACVKKCSIVAGLVWTVSCVTVAASGILLYFSLDGAVDWVVTGSVIGALGIILIASILISFLW